MNAPKTVACAVLLAVIAFAESAAPHTGARADSSGTVSQLAEVLLHFEHTCTPMQCARLREIASDTSASDDVRWLALALTRIVHVVAPDDRAHLKELAASASDPDVRTLADVLGRFVHVARGADRRRLDRLQGPNAD